jgi:hypothetical protein
LDNQSIIGILKQGYSEESHHDYDRFRVDIAYRTEIEAASIGYAAVYLISFDRQPDFICPS